MTAPASVKEAAGLGGVILAAGTALQLAWGDGAPADDLVDIKSLSEARGIRLEAGILRIGALETLETCRTHGLVRCHAGLLAKACGVIGALGVRNLGTLGGNIGWRQGDTIPALLVLGALVECDDGVIPLVDALAQPRLPLLLGVQMPPCAPSSITIFEKVGHRAAFSPSVATVAGWCRVGAGGQPIEARLAVGRAGGSARLLTAAAELLIGTDLRDERLWDRIAASVATTCEGAAAGIVAGRVLAGQLRAALT